MPRIPSVPSRVVALLALALSFAAITIHTDSSLGQQPAAYPTFGTIIRDNPRLNQIIAPDAKLEKLAEGFDWSEGPVWIKDGGYVLFSDIPRNSIMKWKEGEGISLFLRPAGYTGQGAWGKEPGTNGLTLDREGRIVMCNHGDRRIGRLEPTGNQTTLASEYQGKKLNSPNDLAVKSNGDIYFTDPPYGLPMQSLEDPAAELDFCGVYRISTDGTLALLTKEMTRPNGIAFSPDESTLYVAQSDPEKAIWMAFPVKDDGTLGEGKVFYDATPLVGQKPGLPDGMAVDQQGNVFATGPGGVHIFSADGTHLGSIDTGEATANCTFGDDGSTLYITADMYLARIRVATKGIGF